MRSVRRLTDLLVFVGPSGCGKSTIIEKLQAEFPDLFRFSTSHTTRRPRHGEVNGQHYHFVTVEQFQQLLAAEAFVEYTELQTSPSRATAAAATEGAVEKDHQHRGWGAEEGGNTGTAGLSLRAAAAAASPPASSAVTYYGTSKQALVDVLLQDRVVLMDTDVLGAVNIRRFCEGRLAPMPPPPPLPQQQQRATATTSTTSSSAAAGAETVSVQPSALPPWNPAELQRRAGATTSDSSNSNTANDDNCPLRSLSCKVLFIAPPSMGELAERLRLRKSETEDSLRRRLLLGEQWMTWADENAHFFDHRVVNGDLDDCYSKVRRIILSEVAVQRSAL